MAAGKQSKGRKFGRNGRSPSNKLQTYRTEKNTRLKRERHAKMVASHKAKKVKVERGSARAERRARDPKVAERARKRAEKAA